MGRSWIPFAVACLGVASFSAMDTFMKGLSLALGVYNAMLWRMLASTLLAGTVFLGLRMPWPQPQALKLHVLRSVVSIFVSMTFFWGVVRVPLAEGVAVTFIAPLIALYLAVPLLGERIALPAILASALGFAGVVVIVAGKIQAGHSGEEMLGIGILVISSIGYAFSLILQRRQAQLAKPPEIAFFQSLLVFLQLLLVAPLFAVLPEPSHLPVIAGSAITSLLALALLAWAYARAEAQVLLTVEYTAFIWVAVFGYVFLDETITRSTVAGTALIVAGCIIANYRRRRRPYAEAV